MFKLFSYFNKESSLGLVLGLALLPILASCEEITLETKVLEKLICDIECSLFTWEDILSPSEYGYHPEYIKGRLHAYKSLLIRFEEIYTEEALSL